MKARANRTNSTYRSGKASYEKACGRLNIKPWPATEAKLIIYAAYAHETMNLAPKSIRTYLSAICYEHRLSGWANPRGETGLLQLVLDGCKRIDAENGIFPELRQPIDGKALHNLIKSLNLRKFRDARFAAFASLAFYGAFRPCELIMSESDTSFLWSDITTVRHESGIEYLQISQYISKTRQYGPLIRIAIGVQGGPTCPQRLMRNYASMLQRTDGATPVFTSQNGITPYWYDEALQDMRYYLTQAGWSSTKNYSLHSFRIGMATEAGRSELPDSTIKMMGRWTSDCFLRYIRADPLHLARTTAGLAYRNQY